MLINAATESFKQNGRMSDLPPQERPFEKIDRLGIKSLSEAELLAVIFRVGTAGANAVETARNLLALEGGSDGKPHSLRRLQSLTPEEMAGCPGIGPVKIKQVQAALELADRLQREEVEDRPSLATPEEAVRQLPGDLAYQPVEEIWVLLSDCRNGLIRRINVARGGLSQASVFPREVFREAIRANAAGIIMAHNHPSGDYTASKQDLALTARMIGVGRLVAIPLNDHLIVSAGGWQSLRRETDLWERSRGTF